MAERVDTEPQRFRADADRQAPPAPERVLVTVGPRSDAEQLVRAAQRLALRLDAQWTALYVETPVLQRLPEVDRDRILRALRLAEELGGKSVVIGGGDVASSVLEFGRAQNVTRIVVGRPRRRGWRSWIVSSTTGGIVAGAHDLDVAIIGAKETPPAPAAETIAKADIALGLAKPKKRRWQRYVIGAAAPLVATLVTLPFRGSFELANIVMIYLLGVSAVALYLGRGPSIVTSVLSVGAFNFFFVPPFHTFAVVDAQYVVTFAVLLIVGAVISELAARVRLQARIAGYREERASALYEMSRELAATEQLEHIVLIAVKHLSKVFASEIVVLLPDAAGQLRHPRADGVSGLLRRADLAVAQRVHDAGEAAGLGTNRLPASDTLYMPLATPTKTIGVLGVLPANPRRVFIPEQRRLLDTFASQVAVAIERAQLAETARAAELRAESEGIRNSLLAAISHELRTPLATIVGASSSLAEAPEGMSEDARRELARGVSDEARRMSEVIAKVLDLARLQAGATRVQPGWYSIEEVIGTALSRLSGKLTRHRVNTRLPTRSPLARFDAVLVEQVLANLLENAAKYTPPGTNINVAAQFERGDLAIIVTDDGPGLPSGQEAQIFDKFHRGVPEAPPGGAGLGLAICKLVVEAHGGTISAENIPAGGAMFRVAIPQDVEPPSIEEELAEPGR